MAFIIILFSLSTLVFFSTSSVRGGDRRKHLRLPPKFTRSFAYTFQQDNWIVQTTSTLGYRFLLQTIILILLQIAACSTTRAFNVENYDTAAKVVSFDVIRPPPLSSYPAGGEFGNGLIDLGGLKVYEVLYFKTIWNTQDGGIKDLGVTFYEPTSIPTGFHLIGHFCKPNSVAMFDTVLTAQDTTGDPSQGALKKPTDYTLIWSSVGSDVSRQEEGYIWLPVAPDGYKPIGHIVTTSPEKPSLDKVRCVRSDFTELTEEDKWIWGDKMHKTSSSVVSLHTARPKRSTSALGVPTGMFLAQNGSSTHEVACLKMTRSDPYSAMPDSLQIRVMINAYAPLIYLHPDEQFFPSSVLWFFQNGAVLYESGKKNPAPVIDDGENLPTNGVPDAAFLNLTLDERNNERLKKGFLSDVVTYIHVKPALGGTVTDLVIWLYYPFNGGGKFQLGPFSINLGKLGEHLSDWEHVTLRVDNFRGSLKAVYLSQHAKGVWLTPDDFELMNGSTTRVVVYAALNGHAHYSTGTTHLHMTSKLDSSDIRMLYEEFQKTSGSRKWLTVNGEKFMGFGLRDVTAKSNNMIDIASTYNVICIDYKDYGLEPAWLNYVGRWGPKFSYEFTKEVMKITNHLPSVVKKLVIKVLRKAPAELLGQESPQGPKMKQSWYGDEQV